MANSVFENAIVTIRQLLSAVEAEVTRLSTVEVRAQGAQQNLDALRVQQRELQTTVGELAHQISESRQIIDDAKAKAKAIIEGGERKRGLIIAQAEKDASSMREDGKRAGDMMLQDAAREAEHYVTRVAEAKNELAAIKAQMEAIREQVDIAQGAFMEMQRSAAAFASMKR